MLTGFTLCFGHVNAIFQSFFHKFLLGLCRICLCAKVCIMNLVFVICLLLPWLGIDCVTDNINWKLHFLEWITHSFVLKFCPQNTENCIFGLKISNILGQNAPRSLPPSIGKQGGGDTVFDTVGYSRVVRKCWCRRLSCKRPVQGYFIWKMPSILTTRCTLFKPAGYFNFYWNPCTIQWISILGENNLLY